VSAVDGGDPPLSATATLRLTVEDRNDERPRFQRSFYFLNVSENCPPGTSIGRVVAVDPDASPRFARVLYRIRCPTGSSGGGGRKTGNDGVDSFEVDSGSGEVRTARRLDRERRSSYVFTVVAFNDVDYDVTAASGRHDDRRPEVDVADVTVYVNEVNDNKPVFVFPGRERGDVAYLSTNVANRVTQAVLLPSNELSENEGRNTTGPPSRSAPGELCAAVECYKRRQTTDDDISQRASVVWPFYTVCRLTNNKIMGSCLCIINGRRRAVNAKRRILTVENSTKSSSIGPTN